MFFFIPGYKTFTLLRASFLFNPILLSSLLFKEISAKKLFSPFYVNQYRELSQKKKLKTNKKTKKSKNHYKIYLVRTGIFCYGIFRKLVMLPIFRSKYLLLCLVKHYITLTNISIPVMLFCCGMFIKLVMLPIFRSKYLLLCLVKHYNNINKHYHTRDAHWNPM